MRITALMAWFNPTRWLLLLGLALALTAGYFGWRGHQREIGRDEVRAELAAKVVKVDAKRDAVAPPIAAKQEKQQIQIRTVTQTIIKEVPVYVKATDCPMPPGFRVLHDAASHGEIPDPARIPDAAAVPAATVAETVAANYGACLSNATRLTGLQDWVTQQMQLK